MSMRPLHLSKEKKPPEGYTGSIWGCEENKDSAKVKKYRFRNGKWIDAATGEVVKAPKYWFARTV